MLSVGHPIGAQDIIAVGSRLLLSTNLGVFVSDDEGTSWHPSNVGLTSGIGVGNMVQVGSKIFADADDGRYVSADQGATWTPIAATGLPTSSSVLTSLVVGSDLFVGMNAPSHDPGISGALFKSSDGGATFAAASSGLPQDQPVSSLANGGSSIYCAPIALVGTSTDAGATWQTSVLPLAGNVLQVATVGATVLAGTAPGDVFSSFNGATWTAAESGLPKGAPIDLLYVNAGKVYASSPGINGVLFGVYVSSDSGAHWTALNDGFGPAPPYAVAMVAHGGFLFAATDLDGVWRRSL
jgi:photosystem II stability/assembly factor-like uncharacterized protein